MSPSPAIPNELGETRTGIQVPRWLLIVMTTGAIVSLAYSFLVFQVARAALGAIPYVGFDERYFWWPLYTGLLLLAAVGAGIAFNSMQSRRKRVAGP